MINMRQFTILLLTIAFTHLSFGQTIDYVNPKKYEVGPIVINGADNFDHQAIKLIAGIRQGSQITIPGEEITKAIKNLWDEGLFSDVQIKLEKTLGDVAYLRSEERRVGKECRFGWWLYF